jgi:hypothetical protein
VLLQSQFKRWCEARGKLMRPPKLHPAIYRTVKEWFQLVDDDGSGTLEHHELVAALQVGPAAGRRMIARPARAHVCAAGCGGSSQRAGGLVGASQRSPTRAAARSCCSSLLQRMYLAQLCGPPEPLARPAPPASPAPQHAGC